MVVRADVLCTLREKSFTCSTFLSIHIHYFLDSISSPYVTTFYLKERNNKKEKKLACSSTKRALCPFFYGGLNALKSNTLEHQGP